MKKILSLLLAAAMILTFAACNENDPADSAKSGETNAVTSAGDTTSGETDETKDPNETDETKDPNDTKEPAEGEPLDGSKTMAAFELLLQDEFFVEIEMMSIKLARKGADFYVNMMGQEMLLLDGTAYELDHDEKIAYFSEVDESDMEGLADLPAMLDDLLPEDAVVSDTGTAEFMGEELFFEEITSVENDVVMQHFFDEDDNLVGMIQSGMEILFIISDTAPADLFAIPADYEKVEEPD